MKYNMKQIITCLLALTICFSVISCDPDSKTPENQEQEPPGNDNQDPGQDPNPDPNPDPDPDTPAPILVLQADTTFVACNGKDTVFFQVLLQTGETTEEVTADATIYQLPQLLLEAPQFTSTQAGVYEFVAHYNELVSESVIIESDIPQVHNPNWTFQVGDFYHVGEHKGVVFTVSDDGKTGMIVSLDEAYLPWSLVYEQVGAFYMKGDLNFEMICRMPDWEENYPAAKWCADHGEGWFLPCYEETEKLWAAYNGGTSSLNPEAHAVFEQYFTDEVVLGSHFWTSTEITDDMATTFAFIINDVTCTNPLKTSNFCVRAVKKF